MFSIKEVKRGLKELFETLYDAGGHFIPAGESKCVFCGLPREECAKVPCKRPLRGDEDGS